MEGDLPEGARINEEANNALFEEIGGNILYYPAYYVEKNILPAGPVFVLEMDGTIRILDAKVTDKTPCMTTEISQMKTVDISPDTGKPIPAIKVTPGKEYELSWWDDKWDSLGTKKSTQNPLTFDNLPLGRLYRLKEINGRNKERPFTIDAEKQVLW